MAKKIVRRKKPSNKIIEGLKEALEHARNKSASVAEWEVDENGHAKTINRNVYHPPHYGGADDTYETIKVARVKLTKEEFIGAMKFTVMKYNDRARHKDSEIEDYEKGLWYQTELVKRAKEK